MKHVAPALRIPKPGHLNVLVLGCGTAFTGLETFNQSFLILFPDGTYGLVDCGEDIPKSLIYHGVDIKKIRWVYISHLHSDHCFGIPRFGLARYDFSKFPKHFSEGEYAPILYGKKQVLDTLWDCVKAPLATLQNVQGTMETFFEPRPVTTHFDDDGWNFRLIQQVHVVSDAEIMPSFGLIITKPGMKSIYLTTDCQYCSPRQVEDFYKLVDYIVQDCELIGVNTVLEEGQEYYLEDDPLYPGKPQVRAWPSDFMANAELMARGKERLVWARSRFFSGVHANFAQLAGYPSANSTKLSDETKKKMHLSHYQDFKLEMLDGYKNATNWDLEAKKSGFAGFVKTGDYFEL